jgi:hypothetical protein
VRGSLAQRATSWGHVPLRSVSRRRPEPLEITRAFRWALLDTGASRAPIRPVCNCSAVGSHSAIRARRRSCPVLGSSGGAGLTIPPADTDRRSQRWCAGIPRHVEVLRQSQRCIPGGQAAAPRRAPDQLASAFPLQSAVASRAPQVGGGPSRRRSGQRAAKA